MEKAYVILVALEQGVYNYCCTEPKTFYKTKEEAKEQLAEFLKQNTNPHLVDAKIQKLWIFKENS